MHSFQVISLLVTAATGQVVAVPLLSRICEGLKRSGPRLSLLDKLASMFFELTRIAGVPSVLVADAHYASRKVIGEQNITIQYRTVDLLWRPTGKLVRFVLVKHPTRGNSILLSSALTMQPLCVIKLYGLRFKIEVSFKQSLHT